MRFASTLIELEVLSYYDRPLLVLYREQGTGQHWIAAWIDEEPGTVKWHMIALTPEDKDLLLSTDLDTAITLKQAMERSNAVYRCEANTFDYGSITDGTLVEKIEDEYQPGDGSYVHLEVYLAWEARKKGNGQGAVPLTLNESVSPATPDAPDTVPGAHLDWPEISTVPGDLDVDPCPWKQSGFL